MHRIEPYKGRDPEPVITAALQLYDQGKEIDEASVELGVPARTIYRWLGTNATDKWLDAQKGRALADYEHARKHRAQAASVLNDLRIQLDNEGITEGAERNWRLAHAREVLKAADTALDHLEWVLERVLRKIYGQDAPAVQININLGDIAQRINDLQAELLGKQVEDVRENSVMSNSQDETP